MYAAGFFAELWNAIDHTAAFASPRNIPAAGR